jgi:hypothetical protein
MLFTVVIWLLACISIGVQTRSRGGNGYLWSVVCAFLIVSGAFVARRYGINQQLRDMPVAAMLSDYGVAVTLGFLGSCTTYVVFRVWHTSPR